MRLTNTHETYGLVHQVLHWIVAGLILVMIPLGVYMHELPETSPAEIADKVWLYSLHKTLGITALAAALLRIVWATTQPRPRPLHGGWEGFAAATVHWLLYGSIVAVPVFGWLHHASAEGFAPIWWSLPQGLPLVPKNVALSQFFGSAHQVAAMVMAGSLALHIAGALKHRLIDRDQTLARMVPGAYEETGQPPAPVAHSGYAVPTALTVAAVASAAMVALFYWERRVVEPQTSQPVNAPVTGVGGNWIIDPAASTLSVTVLQMGAPIAGTFGRWTANVAFDPEALTEARIDAEIDTGSLTLGDITTRAISEEFLNASAQPTARFVSSEVTATPKGYEARGTLTIGGLDADFALPFTFAEQEGRASVDAQATLNRLDFGVGKGFPDDATVGREVVIDIHIQADRSGDSAKR